jgi:hypothetical protein
MLFLRKLYRIKGLPKDSNACPNGHVQLVFIDPEGKRIRTLELPANIYQPSWLNL